MIAPPAYERFLGIIQSVTDNIELEPLMNGLLPRLMELTDSQCGALFLANNANAKLELKYSIGLTKTAYMEYDLNIGEGLVGAAASKPDITIINDLPDDSVFVIKTFLGMLKPKAVMLVPIACRDKLIGLLAFASLRGYDEAVRELLNLSRCFIAAGISNSVTYERSKRLANELQFQNKLIADLNSDLEDKLLERSLLINGALDRLSSIAVFAVDANGTAIFWNKAAERAYGVTAEEAMSGDVAELIGRGKDALTSIYRYKLERALKYGSFTETGLRVDSEGRTYRAEITYATAPGQSGGDAVITSINHMNEVN